MGTRKARRRRLRQYENRVGVSRIAPDASNQTMQLNDGRTIGYAEYGDSAGKPLLYFHGHPGARYEAEFLAERAKEGGVRLIGVDRPGLGLSTYQARRHLLDWPDDIVELTDYLQIDRFAVVGFSGGGPYALACAFKIPERLTACGTVSGVGRASHLLSFFSTWLPWLVLPMTRRYFVTEERAKKSLARLTTKWATPDQKALTVPGANDTLIASLVEGLRQGTRGAAHDGKLIGSRNWGFELESITFPNVYLWHGELDKDIPVALAREITKKLTQLKASFYPNDAHFSTIIDHGEEILAVLGQ